MSKENSPQSVSKGRCSTIAINVSILLLLTLVLIILLTQPLTLQESILPVSNNFKEYRFDVMNKTSVLKPQLNSFSEVDYPKYNTLLNIVERWNPDIPDPPEEFAETLQHFNFSDPYERKLAEQYRNAEVPFKLYAVPEFNEVVNIWTDSYLLKNMMFQSANIEFSSTNHFMYWSMHGRSGVKNYVPPTTVVHDMSFSQWMKFAKEADEVKLSNASSHYYFMTGTSPGDLRRSFINRDLRLFSTKKENFFITNVRANKGIQCRFGMRGVIAESHYDSGRNMVAMIRGAKRYIIAPPSTCSKLGIISDTKHPSYRHSVIDWSDMSQARSRGFDTVPAIDTILRQGEILYIPSFWFHYIISLQYSIQCNSRSGFPPKFEGQSEINACMGVASKKLWKQKKLGA